jgi:aspartyl aminopeptidase
MLIHIDAVRLHMSQEKSQFSYKKKSGWTVFSEEQIQSAMNFCKEYKSFLSQVKTEREAAEYLQRHAPGEPAKLYLNKHAGAAIVVKGKNSLEEGVRLVIAHIDSPRLDLKQVPLFEDNESKLALFETHYYGGIKKFQWLTIPLALHGIIVKKDESIVPITIGEDSNDPVFVVGDILPHLSHEVQDKKRVQDAIKGESLDIIVGNRPLQGDQKEKIKEAILTILHNNYGMIEEDFVSADLEAVPAYKPRDIGFDASMIGAYGQDDRVCAYTAFKAISDLNEPVHTAIALFVDKEEIGSEGNTSAQVVTFLRSVIKTIDPTADIDTVMLNSKVISADVDAAITPNYKEMFELKNASSLGDGVSISKFTGHGGKSGANDAPAEYVAEIRRLLNDHHIPWQTGELGKVDTGGGGTVAKFFARLGMTVIDLGPPVLSMHSPFEVTSKVDIYACYLAYHAFLSTL